MADELVYVATLARGFYGATDAAKRRECDVALMQWTHNRATWARLPVLLDASVSAADEYALFYVSQAALAMATGAPQQWRMAGADVLAKMWATLDAHWKRVSPFVRNKLCTVIAVGGARCWDGTAGGFAPVRVGLHARNEAGLGLLRAVYERCTDCIPDPQQGELTRVLKVNAGAAAAVCGLALASTPCHSEAVQLMQALVRVDVASVQPLLAALWAGVAHVLQQQHQQQQAPAQRISEEACVAALAVVAEVLDCSSATVPVLGAQGEHVPVFAQVCLEPALWTGRVGDAVLQMATLWVRKQLRLLPVAPLGVVMPRLVALLAMRGRAPALRLLWTALADGGQAGPWMGAVCEALWARLVTAAQRRPGHAGGDDGSSSGEEGDGQEETVTALQEADSPLLRLRAFLFGATAAVAPPMAGSGWADVCGVAARVYGAPVVTWLLQRVEAGLRRGSGPETDAALLLFIATADSLMEAGAPFARLLEVLVALQERSRGHAALYGALAATVEYWERQASGGLPPLGQRSVMLALRDGQGPALDYALLCCRLLRHALPTTITEGAPMDDLRAVACALVLRSHAGTAATLPFRPSQQFRDSAIRAAAAAAWLLSQVCDGGGGVPARVAQQQWVQLLDGGQLLVTLPREAQHGAAADLAVGTLHCLLLSVGPLSPSHAPLLGALDGVGRAMMVSAMPPAASAASMSDAAVQPWIRLLQCIEAALQLRLEAGLRAQLHGLVANVVPPVWRLGSDARPACVSVAEAMLASGTVAAEAQLPLAQCVLEAVACDDLALWTRAMDAYLHVRRVQPGLAWPAPHAHAAAQALLQRLVQRSGTHLDVAERVLFALVQAHPPLLALLGARARIDTQDVFIDALRAFVRNARLQ